MSAGHMALTSAESPAPWRGPIVLRSAAGAVMAANELSRLANTSHVLGGRSLVEPAAACLVHLQYR
jgi:hypothetical protein